MSDAVFQKIHGLAGLSLPMSLVALGWVAGFIVTVGIGSLFWRVSNQKESTFFSPLLWMFCTHWLGMTAATALILAGHLFVPISWPFPLVLLCIGSLGLVSSRKRIWESWTYVRRNPVFLGALAAIFIWFANHSTRGFSEAGDAGLYHIPSARWAEAYRTLPGLAHIHGRLAFNNVNFLHIAALDHGPWNNAGQNPLSGLYYLPIAAASLWAFYAFARRSFTWTRGLRFARIFHTPKDDDIEKREARPATHLSHFFLIAAAPYIIRSMHENAAETTGDVPALCVGLVCWLLVLLVVEKRQASGDQQLSLILSTLMATVALGITVKLSFIVFGGAMLLISCYAASRRAGIKSLVPWLGNKGTLNRHVSKAGSFKWFRAYWNMCGGAWSGQIWEDGDPRGGSFSCTTQRAGISRRSAFPPLPAHTSVCTKNVEKPAHPGYTRSTCPYLRAKALAGSRCLWLALLLSTLLGIAWISRFVIMTGFLVYPNPAIHFNVDWKLPTAKVIDEANWVKSWARDPDRHWREVLSNNDWLGPWFERIKQRRLYKEWIPLGVGAFSLAALGFLSLLGRKRASHGTRIHPLLLAIPPVCAIVFWFHLAPDPRFAGALWLILGATPLAFLLLKTPMTVRKPVFLALILLTVWPMVTRFRTRPGDGRFGFYTIPTPDMTRFETRSGFKIAVPRHGRNCWGIVPSTPSPNPSLALRDGQTIRSGFKLETNDARP
ncbi:MAG: hypothetical protein RRC34_10745 [Lentisphaeria bacterium]|nr:hypothetical protein [Lentisphaeria bacterium]